MADSPGAELGVECILERQTTLRDCSQPHHDALLGRTGGSTAGGYAGAGGIPVLIATVRWCRTLKAPRRARPCLPTSALPPCWSCLKKQLAYGRHDQKMQPAGPPSACSVLPLCAPTLCRHGSLLGCELFRVKADSFIARSLWTARTPDFIRTGRLIKQQVKDSLQLCYFRPKALEYLVPIDRPVRILVRFLLIDVYQACLSGIYCRQAIYQI